MSISSYYNVLWVYCSDNKTNIFLVLMPSDIEFIIYFNVNNFFKKLRLNWNTDISYEIYLKKNNKLT